LVEFDNKNLFATLDICTGLGLYWLKIGTQGASPMPNNSSNLSPLFHIDVSADNSLNETPKNQDVNHTIVDLLQQLLLAQEKQSLLLESLNEQAIAAHRQRTHELGQWKQANPELSHDCRQAAETLSRVQTGFLAQLTNEINSNSDSIADSDFLMNEFVDRYGPRMAHLNGVLQMLSQLSTAPTNSAS